MLSARNRLIVPDTYKESGTFQFDENNPKVKMTIVVRIPTGDPYNSVMMQVSPNIPASFESLPLGSTEMELEPGFHSRTFEAVFYGVRFRSYTPGKTMIVSFVAQ